jgi:hypothetical protein
MPPYGGCPPWRYMLLVEAFVNWKWAIKGDADSCPFPAKERFISLWTLLSCYARIKETYRIDARILFNCQRTRLMRHWKKRSCLIESP